MRARAAKQCPYRGVSWDGRNNMWVARLNGREVACSTSAGKAYSALVDYRRAHGIKLRPRKKYMVPAGCVRVEIIITKDWAAT